MKKSAMVLVLIAGFVFLAGGAFAAPPVKIGVDDVRSGPFKSNGDIALLGLETAVHQINKSGGLLGRQVEPSDRGQPDEPRDRHPEAEEDDTGG